MRHNHHSVGGGLPHLQPYVKILEQPLERGFRFRYKSEAGAHGGLPAETSQRNNKRYPTVQIENYMGPARLEVTLMTNEPEPRMHVHQLVGKNCQDGVCHVRALPENDMIVCFQNLGIQHVPKKEVPQIVFERLEEEYRIQKMMNQRHHQDNVEITEAEFQMIQQNSEEVAKTLELNSVRLCFQAYIIDAEGNEIPIPPVLSNPVFDSKSPNTAALKICRMDKQAGYCSGNDEIYLLCERVQKDDITVRFFELDERGKEIWHDYGKFSIHDVHKQYAIVFKTPPFRTQSLSKPVRVYVQLQKKKDGLTSDPKPFTFRPVPIYEEQVGRKRQKFMLSMTDLEILNDALSMIDNLPGQLNVNSTTGHASDVSPLQNHQLNSTTSPEQSSHLEDVKSDKSYNEDVKPKHLGLEKIVNACGNSESYATAHPYGKDGDYTRVHSYMSGSSETEGRIIKQAHRASAHLSQHAPQLNSQPNRHQQVIADSSHNELSSGTLEVVPRKDPTNTTGNYPAGANININYHHYQQPHYYYHPSFVTTKVDVGGEIDEPHSREAPKHEYKMSSLDKGAKDNNTIDRVDGKKSYNYGSYYDNTTHENPLAANYLTGQTANIGGSIYTMALGHSNAKSDNPFAVDDVEDIHKNVKGLDLNTSNDILYGTSGETLNQRDGNTRELPKASNLSSNARRTYSVITSNVNATNSKFQQLPDVEFKIYEDRHKNNVANEIEMSQMYVSNNSNQHNNRSWNSYSSSSGSQDEYYYSVVSPNSQISNHVSSLNSNSNGGSQMLQNGSVAGSLGYRERGIKQVIRDSSNAKADRESGKYVADSLHQSNPCIEDNKKDHTPMLRARGFGPSTTNSLTQAVNNGTPSNTELDQLPALETTLAAITLTNHVANANDANPNNLISDPLVSSTTTDVANQEALSQTRSQSSTSIDSGLDEKTMNGMQTLMPVKQSVKGKELHEALTESASAGSFVPFLSIFARYLAMPADRGNTPLHESIIHGNEKVSCEIISALKDDRNLVKYVLEHYNDEQKTPIHLMIQYGSLRTLHHALCTVPDSDITLLDGEGCNILHLAAANKHCPVILNYLCRVATAKNIMSSLVNEANYSGDAPIHVATATGNLEMLKVLVKIPEIDINKENAGSGKTALHIACELTDLNKCEHLVEQKNVDINAKTGQGYTPLDIAETALVNYTPSTHDSKLNPQGMNLPSSSTSKDQITDLLKVHGGQHGSVKGDKQLSKVSEEEDTNDNYSGRSCRENSDSEIENEEIESDT